MFGATKQAVPFFQGGTVCFDWQLTALLIVLYFQHHFQLKPAIVTSYQSLVVLVWYACRNTAKQSAEEYAAFRAFDTRLWTGKMRVIRTKIRIFWKFIQATAAKKPTYTNRDLKEHGIFLYSNGQDWVFFYR